MDIQNLQLTDVRIVFGHHERQFWHLEGEGIVGPKDGCHGTWSVGEQAGSDINGDANGVLLVQVFDEFSGKTFNRTVQARSEKSIDDDIVLGNKREIAALRQVGFSPFGRRAFGLPRRFGYLPFGR